MSRFDRWRKVVEPKSTHEWVVLGPLLVWLWRAGNIEEVIHGVCSGLSAVIEWSRAWQHSSTADALEYVRTPVALTLLCGSILSPFSALGLGGKGVYMGSTRTVRYQSDTDVDMAVY